MREIGVRIALGAPTREIYALGLNARCQAASLGVNFRNWADHGAKSLPAMAAGNDNNDKKHLRHRLIFCICRHLLILSLNQANKLDRSERSASIRMRTQCAHDSELMLSLKRLLLGERKQSGRSDRK